MTTWGRVSVKVELSAKTVILAGNDLIWYSDYVLIFFVKTGHNAKNLILSKKYKIIQIDKA